MSRSSDCCDYCANPIMGDGVHADGGHFCDDECMNESSIWNMLPDDDEVEESAFVRIADRLERAS